MKEIRGLIENATFEIVERAHVGKDARIFISKFLNSLTLMDRRFHYKSQVVAQNYDDDEGASTAKKVPTVQHLTKRLTLFLAASLPNLSSPMRDITQAYVQSCKSLEREIYLLAPAGMMLALDSILKVVKPLYDIPKSCLY